MSHVRRDIVTMREEVLIKLKRRIPHTALVKMELLILLHFENALIKWFS